MSNRATDGCRPANRQRTGRRLALAFGALWSLGSATVAQSQMPGLPVLQNGFTGAGFAVAGNIGTAADATGYGAAIGWAPGSGRFQLSAGVGAMVPDTGSTLPSYGARLAVPLLRGSLGNSLGVTVFAGAGAASRRGTSELTIPVGAALGYRRAVGETGGFSLYVAPFYSWGRTRRGEPEVTASNGVVRVSAGVDVTITPAFGATLGIEAGATTARGEPNPAGPLLGAALSYAFRRDR